MSDWLIVLLIVATGGAGMGMVLSCLVIALDFMFYDQRLR